MDFSLKQPNKHRADVKPNIIMYSNQGSSLNLIVVVHICLYLPPDRIWYKVKWPEGRIMPRCGSVRSPVISIVLLNGGYILPYANEKHSHWLYHYTKQPIKFSVNSVPILELF